MTARCVWHEDTLRVLVDTRILLPTFGVPKPRDMKTWMMSLAVLAMATTMTAQDARLSSEKDARGGVYRTNIQSGEFYGTLVAFKQANNELIRFNVDDIVLRATRDQDFLKAVNSLKTFRFDNVGQALNVLASHGWQVRSTMVLEGRSGEEKHFVMARPVSNIMPLSPWLDTNAKGRSGQK